MHGLKWHSCKVTKLSESLPSPQNSLERTYTYFIPPQGILAPRALVKCLHRRPSPALTLAVGVPQRQSWRSLNISPLRTLCYLLNSTEHSNPKSLTSMDAFSVVSSTKERRGCGDKVPHCGIGRSHSPQTSGVDILLSACARPGRATQRIPVGHRSIPGVCRRTRSCRTHLGDGSRASTREH